MALRSPQPDSSSLSVGFLATPECELLDRRKFKTKAEARMAIFEFIEGWYNPARRHSALGYQSPINYERSTVEGLLDNRPDCRVCRVTQVKFTLRRMLAEIVVYVRVRRQEKQLHRRSETCGIEDGSKFQNQPESLSRALIDHRIIRSFKI